MRRQGMDLRVVVEVEVGIPMIRVMTGGVRGGLGGDAKVGD
jgi:hypothetical protein